MTQRIRTVFRWHRWLGLGAGVLLIVIGVSGSVAVFKAEIDWLATPPLRASHSADGPPSADRLLEALRTEYPDGEITAVELAPAPGFAHRALVRPSGLRRTHEVFLDPVTGAVRGDREVGEGYFWSIQNFVRQLHVRLLMGAWGRVFVGVLGVLLILSCLTGFYVYRGWLGGLWRLRWHGLSGAARARELHKWIGVWSLAFNLLIAITGAVLGLENLVARVQSHWLGQRVGTEPLPRAAAEGVPLPAALLVARARSAFPDLHATWLSLPRVAGDPAIVRGDAGLLIARGRHHVALDPVTGAVLAVADRRTARGWERAYLAFDPLHFGYFGGYGVKALWFLLGLAPGALGITGFLIWWRRRSRTPAAPVPAPQPALTRQARCIAAISAGAAALAGLAIAGRTHGWTEAALMIEHGVAKPLALALTAFPLSGLIVALALRCAARPLAFGATCALGAAYYASLATLFQ